MTTITADQLRDLANIQHARSLGETPLLQTPAWLAAERIEALEEQLAELEIQTAQLSARLVESDVERDKLAAHQADLVRELTSCQAVLHSLAHSGEVTPEYADGAKAVLKRTKEASLARRDAAVRLEFAREAARRHGGLSSIIEIAESINHWRSAERQADAGKGGAA